MIWILSVFFVLAETKLDTLRIDDDGIDFYEPERATRVDKNKIESVQSGDIGKVVRNVPGVYVRDEDGFGLRPNIGLRGTNPDRSKKVVLMEDGILIAPAPYSAPAAYYTPSLLRTETVDIYKGVRSIEFGPNSVGGAVNYESRQITDVPEKRIELGYGSYKSSKALAIVRGPTRWGGYLLNYSALGTEGFKEIDSGGRTGFLQQDVLAKIRVPLGGSSKLEFRLGYGEEDSKETYLGLTEDDFARSPFRRYAASQLDNMRWAHRKAQVAHSVQISKSVLLENAVYLHEFDRTWYRFNGFGSSAPTLAQVFSGADSKFRQYLEVLQGQRASEDLGKAGELFYVRNKRFFFSRGAQSQLIHVQESSDWSNTLSIGLRWHQDQIESTPTSDSYHIEEHKLSPASTQGRVDANTVSRATAISLSLKDSLSSGDWTVSFFGRLENVEFSADDRLRGTKSSRSDEVAVPGISVAKQFGSRWQARTSYNKAVTVSGRSIGGEEKNEVADNYEAEIRYKTRRYSGQLTYFLNDYQNLTGTCNASNGCAEDAFGAQFNGGKALVDGIEAQWGMGVSAGRVWMPLYLSYTYLHARFNNSFYSDSGNEWGFGQIDVGDPLPYIPRHQYSLNIGAEYKSWKQNLSITYQSSVFDQSVSEGRIEILPYGIVDWFSSYSWTPDRIVFLKWDNIFSKDYAVAAKPFGLRPGKRSSILVGLNFQL